MFKKVLVLVFFMGHVVSAQVGIGTTDPKSTLEVVGSPSSATSKDGFIPPKLQRSQLIAKTGYGVDQTGAVVFVTDVSGTTNTATVKVTTAGYYYWDGDSWEPLGNSGDGRNIYTEDGSLTSNRIVTQGTSNLAFTSTASSGTSHFSVDGSTFNVNAVANNVGIGTSNPLFPLHVQSNVFGFSIDRHNIGSGAQSIISLRKNLSNDPSVFVPLTLGSNIGSISFSGVNGGTTAFGPYVPLGNATRIMARAEENFTPTSAASGLGFFTTPTGALGAIERLTIKGDGNVGIGTTTPTAQFHTTGTVRFEGAGTPTLGKSLVTDATGLATWQNPLASNTTNTEIVASATQVAVPSTNVQGAISDLAAAIKTTQNSTIYTADGALTANRTVTQGANTLAFNSTAVNGFSVDGSTFSVDALNNRIGIGNTSPNLSLDITSISGLGIKPSNVSQWDHLFLSSDGSSSYITAGGAETGLQFRVGSGSTGTYGGQPYTTTMTMMSSGNVGIGTTTPTNTLDVGGNFKIHGNALGDFSSPELRPHAVTGSFTVYTGAVGSGLPRLTVTNAGNVGIGTTTPNAPLQFANTLANRKVVLWQDGNNDHQFYGLGINSTTFRYQVSGTLANHIFYAGSSSTTSNELMRIQGNGNVGIGTSTPVHKLTISGSQALGVDNGSTFLARNSAGAYENFLWPRWTDNIMYLNYGAGGFNIRNNSSASTMFMTNSGFVGIGVVPVTKLDLNGIKSTGAGSGTGGANDAASQAIIPAGNNGSSRFNDWPAGWGGGLSTWDIVGASTVFNSYLTRSDFRLKNDIKSIDNSIFSSFMKIRPVTYFMKEQTKEMEGLQYGFIAQEIRDLFPSMVTKSDDPNATIGMNYQALISPTIYVVQHQQSKIEELQKQVDSQNEKLSKMEEELKQIKELLSK